MEWICRDQAELDAAELHALLALRSNVFVVEQNCAYNDVDGRDLAPGTAHLWAFDGAGVVACARLLAPDESGDASIGRVAVAPRGRGAGLAHAMLERAVDEAGRRWPGRPIHLSAQSHLQAFYERHGFTVVGETYLDDGIAHVGMRRAARDVTAPAWPHARI